MPEQGALLSYLTHSNTLPFKSQVAVRELLSTPGWPKTRLWHPPLPPPKAIIASGKAAISPSTTTHSSGEVTGCAAVIGGSYGARSDKIRATPPMPSSGLLLLAGGRNISRHEEAQPTAVNKTKVHWMSGGSPTSCLPERGSESGASTVSIAPDSSFNQAHTEQKRQNNGVEEEQRQHQQNGWSADDIPQHCVTGRSSVRLFEPSMCLDMDLLLPEASWTRRGSHTGGSGGWHSTMMPPASPPLLSRLNSLLMVSSTDHRDVPAPGALSDCKRDKEAATASIRSGSTEAIIASPRLSHSSEAMAIDLPQTSRTPRNGAAVPANMLEVLQMPRSDFAPSSVPKSGPAQERGPYHDPSAASVATASANTETSAALNAAVAYNGRLRWGSFDGDVTGPIELVRTSRRRLDGGGHHSKVAHVAQGSVRLTSPQKTRAGRKKVSLNCLNSFQCASDAACVLALIARCHRRAGRQRHKRHAAVQIVHGPHPPNLTFYL